MDSHRRPSGRRAVLLPYEVDLCEQLGITADEYWDFIANAHDFIKERPEEFAYIPDVRNGLTATTLAIIQLVVGVAVTAISVLMAPKPKSLKKRPKVESRKKSLRKRLKRSHHHQRKILRRKR